MAVCVLAGTAAAARGQANENNLRQIALAMTAYSDAHKGFPPAALCDKAGKPLLSWRVAILPFLEQDGLHQQFKLNEPWDSPANKKLIERMPRVFDAAKGGGKPGETNYRVFVGGGALFDLKQRTPLRQITDGTSNTFLVVEAADAVPWTAPRELDYGVNTPLPMLGVAKNGRFGVAFADGSVRRLSTDLGEAKLRAGITKTGGEVVNFGE
jgi:prepilin-type processing-associated H-X9-DG protein